MYHEEPTPEEEAILADTRQEWLATDSGIHQQFVFVAFVSKSKGWRNGKRRIRKHWKEVELVKYRDGRFRLSHLFPWDVVAPEALGLQFVDNPEEVEQALRDLVPIYGRKR